MEKVRGKTMDDGRGGRLAAGMGEWWWEFGVVFQMSGVGPRMSGYQGIMTSRFVSKYRKLE